MYLILKKRIDAPAYNSCCISVSYGPQGERENAFFSFFTDDMKVVSEYLKKPEVKVYKLDRLTEVKEIEVTYLEIIKEIQ